MKKVLLCTVAVLSAWALSAQVVYKGNNQRETVKYQEIPKEVNSATPGKKVTVLNQQSSAGDKAGLPETILGNTTYDLMSNNSTHDRIAVDGNGNISVVWTASSENSTTFDDRGAGYSHYSPTAKDWQLSPSYPRIESDRCGWPSIMYDADGGEIIISHSTASNVMKLNHRPVIGTGSWTEKNISTRKLTWNRAAIGGANGNTIHMIAATDVVDSAFFQGLENAIVYYRSKDKGATFDKVDVILPGLGSADVGKGDALSIDAYSIIAKGDHVAVVVYNEWNDVILVESMDNGDTWTPTIVHEYPYQGFADLDNNGDTTMLVTCDGSGSVVIDNNDVVHVSWGRRTVSNNDVLGDNSFQRRFFTDSIGYFKNSTPPLVTFSGYYMDDNQNNAVDITMYSSYRYKGVVSFPNLAVGTDGTIYQLYGAIADTAISGIDGVTNMRHIYLTKSTNGGTTWSTPEDLTTSDLDLSENVFGDIHHVVDASGVRISYMRDPYPSVYVPTIGATNSPGANDTWQTNVSINQIVYLGIDSGLHIGIEHVLSPLGESSVYPNPSNGILDMTIRVFKDVQVDVYFTNLQGQVVHTYNGQPLKVGRNQIQFDLTNLDPGMYILNLKTENSILTEKVVLK